MPAPKEKIIFKADDPETYVMLAYALSRLKVTQSEFYKDLMQAFDAVVTHHARNMAIAPPHKVNTIYSQGRFKAVFTLSEVVDRCVEIVKKYEAKQEAVDAERSKHSARTAG